MTDLKKIAGAFGMNVSNLYIAQVKREFGIVERANYNVSVEHYSY